MTRAPRLPYPQDYASHLPILIGLGSRLKIRRILELGAGDYSTSAFLNYSIFPYLIELVSVEDNPEWAQKVQIHHPGARLRMAASEADIRDYSLFDLIFVDSVSAPARVESLNKFMALAHLPGIVVVHDTEVPTYHEAISRFPYKYEFKVFEPETSVLWRDSSKSDSLGPTLNEIDSIIHSNSTINPDRIDEWLKIFAPSFNPAPPCTVSVAMPSYQRSPQLRNTLRTYLEQTRQPQEIIVVEDGFDGGATQDVCTEAAGWGLPVRYLCRHNRPNLAYSNSAIPRNIGIRAATGDIIILSSPEVRFTQPTDIANLIAPVESDLMVSCCAPCRELLPDGSLGEWRTDPDKDYFNHYCQAYRRQHFLNLGGFDETFVGFGAEDGDLNLRLHHFGIRCVWARDVVTEHQWHPQLMNDCKSDHDHINNSRREEVIASTFGDHPVLEANQGKDWGDINS